MKGMKKQGLYEVFGEIVAKCNIATGLITKEEKAMLWHNRIGHTSEKGLQVFSKQGLLEGDQVSNLEFCEDCVMGKQHRLSFKATVHISKGILDYAHVDLWGPARQPTHGVKVENNVRVEHMAGRKEDIVHLDHENGEEEDDATTNNNPNLRNYL
ncbi:hypothetical protein UlMin_003994 [Ulmus minor]